MIKKLTNSYILVCDNCLYEEDQYFKTLNDVHEFKKNKRNGWRAHMTPVGQWEDNCPLCVKVMYASMEDEDRPLNDGGNLKCHNQNVHKYKDFQI